MTLVMCVVSRSRSMGKTSLIEALTEKFCSEGLRVATVKHIHRTFDTFNKDTWRHMEAGAVITVAATPTEVITIRKSETPSLEDVLKVINVEADLILVEGYKKSAYPKILCTESASDLFSAVKEISNIVMVSGLIKSKSKEEKMVTDKFPEIGVYDLEEMVFTIKDMLFNDILRSLPGLNCGHCGYDTCLGLAKAILKGDATKEKCEVLSTNLTTLKVDGKVVPLSKFPQKILKSVTLGVLNNLKDVGEHQKKIEVIINEE